MFALGERGEHLATLATWREQLTERQIPPDRLELHRFGRAGEHSRADHTHPALTFDVDLDDGGVTRLVRVEVTGRTLPVGAGGAVSVTLSKRANEGNDEWSAAGRRRLALRAFLDHAVLAAAGIATPSEHASVAIIATREEPVVDDYAFAPLSRDAATAWLRGVVRELLGAPHTYFMPCEAVFVHRKREVGTSLARVIEEEARDKLRGDGPPALRSVYGPVPRPQEYALPDGATAAAMVELRFSPFFAGKDRP